MKCVICNLHLTGHDEVTVKSRGIEKLTKASIERADGKENIFPSEEVRLHRKCRLLYIDQKSIAASKKRRSEPVAASSFGDFQTCCLFCGESAETSTSQVVSRVIKRPETQATIVKAATDQNDAWSQKVLQRIAGVDLQEKQAVYHGHCYSKFCHPNRSTGLKRGRPQSSENLDAIELICHFLETNEDCQFSISEIRQSFPDVELPSDSVIKYNLTKKYGNGIIIISGNPSVICFLEIGNSLIQKSWTEAKTKENELEKNRIIDSAAKILAEDVRSQVYNTDTYPPPNGFLQTAKEVIPETLLRFLEKIIMPNKKEQNKYERKCIAIAHTIVTATRPKSFKSPVMLGLSTLIHHKYACRYLIDMLSCLGFCATYSETLKFQSSAIASYTPIENNPNFAQFVFDNADVNVQTIDGHNTFHTMGGIQLINPPQTISMDVGIPRLNYVPPGFMKNFDQIPMQTYFKPTKSGLSDVSFEPPSEIESTSIAQSDLLWMYGKSQGFPDVPGWNTFMTLVQNERIDNNQMIEVKPLPFINAPASSNDTILTALHYAVQQCRQSNIDCCIVTFDQPLYQKAQEIVKSSQDPQLSKIILRLGGFHLLMSFMGAVGQIMNGSGLKELWASIFAIGSLEKMFSGHQYDRCVRAHSLTSLALFDLIMQEANLTLEESLDIESAIHDITNPDNTHQSSVMDVQSIIEKHEASVQKLEERGNTAKLWVMYYKMTLLIHKFIKAERTGDWALHISTIKEMMPYFLAANHFNYGKSASLYLSDMENLQQAMTPECYEKFVTQKLFTVRRTNKPFSGTWSDMTIEQSLMRSMKTAGGLTHGRGLSDEVLGRWILGLPIVHAITEEMESFCDRENGEIPKHKDGSRSRMERDAKDLNSLKEWLQEHPPFPETPEIVSLSSGLTGDSNINPHMAQEVGLSIMQKRAGVSYSELKFSRKEAIKSLAILNSAVTLHETPVPIEPDLIFKRISFIKKSQEELKEHLEYELSPYPLALFDEKGMRKTNKAAFYDLFTADSDEIAPEQQQNIAHVLDGGHLLHKVVWPKGITFGVISAKYVQYVLKFKNPAVVFDGYDSPNCIKTAERLRRCKGKTYPNIIFDENTTCTMASEHFLTNDKNKKRLITMVATNLRQKEVAVKISDDDADTLIVSTAVELANTNQYDNIIVIGEDIDLLAIITATKNPKIKLLKPGKGKVVSRLYSTNSFIGDPDIAAVAHAFTGCDTTSAIFKQGKKKSSTKIINRQDRSPVNIFTSPNSTTEEVAKAGEELFCGLYGGPACKTSLSMLRYEKFSACITKSSVDLATLPPTVDAAKQHSLRVYLQVQKWLFNELNPTDWGWETSASGLVPICTREKPAPDEILKMISCKCKQTCKKTCSCVKSGVKCTALCVHCTDKISCTDKNIVLNDNECDDHEQYFDNLERDNENRHDDDVSCFDTTLSIATTSSGDKTYAKRQKQ